LLSFCGQKLRGSAEGLQTVLEQKKYLATVLDLPPRWQVFTFMPQTGSVAIG
jgi:hypothetical protein